MKIDIYVHQGVQELYQVIILVQDPNRTLKYHVRLF